MSPRKKLLKTPPDVETQLTCTKCGKRLPLKKFYPNPQNISHYYTDAWCKSCLVAYIKDEKTLREAFYFNNRELTDALLKRGEKEADAKLAVDTRFNTMRSADLKQQHRWRLIAQCVFRIMNQARYYAYRQNDIEQLSEEIKEMDEYKRLEQQREILEASSAAKVFSETWNGIFTEKEIEFLDTYYGQLEEQFDISDAHLEMTFRKVAKAALDQDNAYNAMRANPDDAKLYNVYTQATATFVKLSDSAKLSANKRSSEGRVGVTTLSEIIEYIEKNGYLSRTIEFPKDDVDRLSDMFRHFAASFSSDDLQE